MKYIKIHNSAGRDRFIRLYSTKRSKNIIAVKTAENEILYAGSGTSVSGPSVMKVQTAAGTQDICEYADDIPATKMIAEYSTTQDVTLSKDLFPLGGYVRCYGANGANSYGAGGKGSSATMYFGALQEDTVLHVTIGVNNGSAGTAGSNVSITSYYCHRVGEYNIPYCKRRTITSNNAYGGGAGGKGTRATLDLTGETINAYGGGGGGGGRGSILYNYDCDATHAAGYDCKMSSSVAYGSFGSGGAAGNGAAGSGVNGGSAGTDIGAVVRVFAFTE